MLNPVRIIHIPGTPTVPLPKVRTIGLRDEFERADNAATLGASDDRKVPVPLRGTWGIAGGAAYVSALGSGGAQVVVWDTRAADGQLEADFTNVVNDASAGLILRALNISNHLILNSAGGGKLRLWKRVGGAATAIIDGPASVGAIVSGDRITVKLTGTHIRVERNGALALEADVPEFVGATSHGLAVNSTATRIGRVSFTPTFA